jgi:hypothetical protein
MEELSATTTDKIKNKGGRVFKNAKVQLIFWGDWNNPSIDPSKEKIETAIQNIINSEYYSKLYQYGQVQKPTYLGSIMNHKSRLPEKFYDDDLEGMIIDSIKNKSVPDFGTFADGQIIYMVIPIPNHYSADEAKQGEDANDGYHSNFEYKGNKNGVWAAYYGYPDEDRTLESITRVLAHEIAECCTNPGPKDAFIGPKDKNNDGEIADYCTEEMGTVNGETVEGYWSNLDGGCVIPGGSNIRPVPD